MAEIFSDVELVIKIVMLKSKASELRTLASTINSRTCDISFQQGSGNLVNEFMNTVQELKNVGDALYQLCDTVATRIDDAANQFEFADNTLADMFEKAIASVGGNE